MSAQHKLVPGASNLPDPLGWSCLGCCWMFSYEVDGTRAQEIWAKDYRHAPQPTDVDPWATTTTEPTYLTRDDRIEAGARALGEVPGSDNWPSRAVRLAFRKIASYVLDAAYPQVTTVDQLEALPAGTVIVSETGMVLMRLKRARSKNVWVERWNQPLDFASSSATVAANADIWGHVWTVVHREKP